MCSPISAGSCINRWTSLESQPCNFDDECASGSCFIHYGRGICDPFGTVSIGTNCQYNYDCASGLCGLVGPSSSVCTVPFSESSSSFCGSDRECASHLCVIDSCGS